MSDRQSIGPLVNRLPPRLYLPLKSVYQWLLPSNRPPSILFIVGCQRSGTTLMLDLLRKDLRAKTYGEFSSLSSNDPMRIRLNDYESVAREMRRHKVPVIVLKPLVESQNVVRLLQYFEGSKALWMYRDYKDVANSNLKKFGEENGIQDLRPIVDGVQDNWRSEWLPDSVRQTVRGHFSQEMNRNDAAVLFWYVRNHIFFDLELDKRPDVLTCKYEQLISDPVHVVRRVYSMLGQPYPGPWITAEIHARSISQGKAIQLSAPVDNLARELLQQIDDVHWREWQ